MQRFALAAAVLLLGAASANAETSVKVRVAGLDAQTAHRAIVKAAETACREELRYAPDLQAYYMRPSCITDAIAAAEAQAPVARAQADAAQAARAQGGGH